MPQPSTFPANYTHAYGENMATKDQLRNSIVELEPDNVVAADDGATHSDLTKELRAAKRRAEAKAKASSIPAVAKYRLEDDTHMSWKLCRADTEEPVTDLSYGDQLPLIGDWVEFDGTKYKVVKQESGLEITAGDLDARDKFDARRIYITPNGTSVVFMRMDKGRAVLWSYKAQAEIAIGGHVVLARSDRLAKPRASKNRKMTQKVLASWVIAQNPTISADELTSTLKDAFPSANIGQRHGPHYLSLSRNGRLPEAPDTDPRTWGDGL